MPPHEAPATEADKERLQRERQAFFDRLDDLVTLTRQGLRRVRRQNAAGLVTEDVVYSALASAAARGPADAESVSSAEEADLVWIAMRRALGRKIYKYYQSPLERRLANESQVAPADTPGWLEGLATKEISERDLAECYAAKNEVLAGLGEDERLVAELLLLGHSAREIGDSPENTLSYGRVRRLIESMRAHFRKQGFGDAEA